MGHTAAAKSFDEDAVRLAVTAHVRHAETEYDSFLAQGYDRREARALVSGAVERVLGRWGASA